MHFVRGKVRRSPTATGANRKRAALILQYEDTLLGKQRRLPVDMVVLMGAMEPHGRGEGVRHQVRHFVQHGRLVPKRHPKLDPVATMTDGVFVAGCARGRRTFPPRWPKAPRPRPGSPA